MGRPIKKTNFSDGTDPSKPALMMTAKVPNFPAQEVYAISQAGTKSYRVLVNGRAYTVRLTKKTDIDDLNDGEAFILAGNEDIGFFSVNKISQHMVSMSGTQGNLIAGIWEATPASEGTNLDVDHIIDNDPTDPPPAPIPPKQDPETDPIVEYDTGINSMFLRPEGDLNVGSGIMAESGLTVAKTNFIEIGIMAHLRGTFNRRTISNNVYDLSLGTNPQWNVTWSVGITHPDVTNITDMYDVKFYTYLNSDGSKNDVLVSDLVFEDGIYKVRSQYGDVVDSGTDAETRSVQNSSSLSWISMLLVPPVDAGEQVLGTFSYAIAATNKVSGKETRCEIIINVTE